MFIGGSRLRDHRCHVRTPLPPSVQICWPPDETSSTDAATVVVTLPTSCARDGKGPGHQYGLPDLIEAGRRPAGLLPAPTGGDGTGDAALRAATADLAGARSRPPAR